MELDNDIQKLYANIALQIKQAKTKIAITANSELALLYCNVGKSIQEFVLQGNRAAYGKEIKVAQYLTELPSKEWFADKLHRAIEIAKMNREVDNG